MFKKSVIRKAGLISHELITRMILASSRCVRKYISLLALGTSTLLIILFYLHYSDNDNNLYNKTGVIFPKSGKHFLVILIFTAPANIERRNTIRDTWLSNVKTKYLFILGTQALDDDVSDDLYYEHIKYNDLLLLPKLKDSYSSLTNKLIESLIWVHSNLSFIFLLKCDDDTFVNVPALLTVLEDKPRELLYYGFFYGKGNVKKHGQWAEPNWILCDKYLPYARGGGYILTQDLVAFISSNSKMLQTYNSEDVSVGAWLAPVRVTRLHDPRFDTEAKSRGCSNKYIVTHKQSPLDMREKTLNLMTKGVLCSVEEQFSYGYIYNWDIKPSLCCVRNDSSIP